MSRGIEPSTNWWWEWWMWTATESNLNSNSSDIELSGEEATGAWVIQLKCYVVVINKMISRERWWTGRRRMEWKVSFRDNSWTAAKMTNFHFHVVHVHKIESVIKCRTLTIHHKNHQRRESVIPCETRRRALSKRKATIHFVSISSNSWNLRSTMNLHARPKISHQTTNDERI